MASLSTHHEELTNGIGMCSVPMWMDGCPAGFCDKPAYGKRPEGQTLARWDGQEYRLDGRYAGYVPALACHGHGGPEAPPGVIVKKDGNAWCVHGEDFINLQESRAEFGDTKDEAIEKYMIAALEDGETKP
jgi:hypothetical protein